MQSVICTAAYLLGEYGRLIKASVPSLEQYRLLRELFATAGNVTKALLMSAFLKIYLQDSQVCIWDAIHMVVCRGFHGLKCLGTMAFNQLPASMVRVDLPPCCFVAIGIVRTGFGGLGLWHVHC